MDNNNSLREFLRQKVNEDIVIKYLFLESKKGNNYQDEYIRMTYGIDSKFIKEQYDRMNEKDRKRVEEKLKSKIEAGEIDLNEEAVKWHKETLKRDYLKGINSQKAKKRYPGEKKEGR